MILSSQGTRFCSFIQFRIPNGTQSTLGAHSQPLQKEAISISFVYYWVQRPRTVWSGSLYSPVAPEWAVQTQPVVCPSADPKTNACLARSLVHSLAWFSLLNSSLLTLEPGLWIHPGREANQTLPNAKYNLASPTQPVNLTRAPRMLHNPSYILTYSVFLNSTSCQFYSHLQNKITVPVFSQETHCSDLPDLESLANACRHWAHSPTLLDKEANL